MYILHIFFIFLFIFLHIISFIIPSYFLLIFFIFLHISFIIPSYFFIFLGLGKISSFLQGSGIWKNSKLPPRIWDLEIFLHISFILSSPLIYGLRDLDKIRVTSNSSMDMKHVSISGTWTGIFDKYFNSINELFNCIKDYQLGRRIRIKWI